MDAEQVAAVLDQVSIPVNVSGELVVRVLVWLEKFKLRRFVWIGVQ